MSPENLLSLLINFYVKLKLIYRGFLTLLAAIIFEIKKMLTLQESVQM